MNLNQITIPVQNIERAITFYEELGLTLIVKALPHYARFECNEGQSTFSLHQASGPLNNGGTWIYFEVEKLDEKVAELVQKGYLFEELPNGKSWLWRESRLKDLDGNQLILYYAGENRKSPPWKI
ncbi:MAG: glyoxalase/bleomycin resistance/extradiol dioxygenase family protein [Chitinophagaceae bacterium]|nr:glyoxalase/bleomycin resistance/extradiol dioxygenase family protein [Chitinophagaceae bacterium]